MILILLNHSSSLVMTIPPLLGDTSVGGWQRDFLNVLQSFGIVAVPTYFVISGAFLAYAFQGVSKEKRTWAFAKFTWHSLEHILWPYLIWSGIFYVVIYMFYGMRFDSLGYIKNLLVGYPYNFVPMLAFFYFLSPVLIWVGKRHAFLLLLVFLSYQMFLLNLVYPGFLGFTFSAWATYLRPPIISKPMADWGMFFPVGIVYGLEKTKIMPWLTKAKPFFFVLFLLCLIATVLNEVSIIQFPQARVVAGLAFVCLIPAIDRNSIPAVRILEQIGKHSYGFYLSQLVILDLVLFLVHVLAPWMFSYAIALAMLCFVLVLLVPWVLMIPIIRLPGGRIHTYLFG